MDRETTILLAFALLSAAGAVVSLGAWILLHRERRALRQARLGRDEPA